MTQRGSSDGMAMAKVLFVLLGVLVVALTAALATSQAVDAAGTKPGIIRKSVDLTATKAGKRIAAEAVAEIRARKAEGLQEFGVDMETIRDATGKSAVAEGARFRVFITNSRFRGRTFMVGRIVMDKSGHGLLAFSNDPVHIEDGARPLRRSMRPVTKIRHIALKNRAGRVILRGSF